ncbi:MAG: chemotaxis protein CheX [Chitinispirillaceae bacterium]|jgi:chemotaxis protein CheX|nr:chemotaxis protein CheX [Chitinispirillaceae bacterium]
MTHDLYSDIKKAFTDSTVAVFGKTLRMPITPLASTPDSGTFAVSGIIGFSGDIIGTCALRLSADGARGAVSRLAGEPITIQQEIDDGVGELVNMIAGSARAALTSVNISLAFPEIIHGTGHQISVNRQARLTELFFSSDIGVICVIVAYSNPSQKGTNAA